MRMGQIGVEQSGVVMSGSTLHLIATQHSFSHSLYPDIGYDIKPLRAGASRLYRHLAISTDELRISIVDSYWGITPVGFADLIRVETFAEPNQNFIMLYISQAREEKAKWFDAAVLELCEGARFTEMRLNRTGPTKDIIWRHRFTTITDDINITCRMAEGG